MKSRATVGALTAALLSAATPVTAAPGLEISDVRVDRDVRTLTASLSARGLQPGTGLNPTSLTATVDGRTLPATTVVAASDASVAEPPVVLLVVDTSGSMAGQPMAEAKSAISEFAAQAPADVGLGLLTFSTRPQLVVRPTLNRSALLGAVARLEAQGETSLYDAIIAGTAIFAGDRDQRLVVLSDGGDTRSRSSLQQAIAATRSSGVSVDAIGFNTDESVQNVLAQVASSGGGRVHSAASSAELGTALRSAVQQHPTALNIRLLVPQDLRGSRTLTLTVRGPSGPLSARTPVTLGAEPAVAASPAGWWSSKRALLAGLAAIAAGLLLGSLALLGGGQRDRRKTQAVLERYTTAPVREKEDLRTASPVTRTALAMADRVTAKRNLTDRSTLMLARAAISMTPAEWLLLQAGAAFGGTLLLVLLGWNLLLALVLGTAVGVFGPSAFAKLRGSRRQKAFSDKLPDALQLTAGSLSAGYSLAQALDGLVREGGEPMATEIGRALAESRLGVPVETTLDGVAERMGSRDFGWVVMAIRVQREVGGNLAGILTTVAATMRERAMLRRHVRGLSAEGRLSAYILIGLPVFLAIYMLTLRREYIEPLYTTGIGIGLIVLALVLLSLGSFVMSRMVKVEV